MSGLGEAPCESGTRSWTLSFLRCFVPQSGPAVQSRGPVPTYYPRSSRAPRLADQSRTERPRPPVDRCRAAEGGLGAPDAGRGGSRPSRLWRPTGRSVSRLALPVDPAGAPFAVTPPLGAYELGVRSNPSFCRRPSPFNSCVDAKGTQRR